MEKILGIDLGTNSIGWAIRDTSEIENQIIYKGVLTFKKGVAEEKGIEVPMVKVRTEARGKRRNYQAEKYRKYNLLQSLIENKMCPLSIEELNEWRHYTKGVGRKYPQGKKFIDWLRFDFDGDGKPDFERFGLSKHESYYVFRSMIVDEGKRDIFRNEPHIIGRVLYQLVQRRGYNNLFNLVDGPEIDENGEDLTKKLNEHRDVINPYIKEFGYLGSALYNLQKRENVRIRNRINFRDHYDIELKAICDIQDLGCDLYKKLRSAIIDQRPLRSQKGLVGFCTLDRPLKSAAGKYYKPGKKRVPLSHPIYEEFRTWVDINNLKIEPPKDVERLYFLEHKVFPIFNRASDLTYNGKKNKKTGKQDEKGIKERIIDKVDHKNLNVDVDFMFGKLASCETLVMEFWKIQIGRASCRERV